MIAVDAIVGVRLLLLASRTRQVPEFALGLAFVLLGAVGYPLTTVARRGVLPSEDTNQILMAVGLLVQNVACFAVYVQTAYTFRRGWPGSRILLAVAGVAFAGSWIGQGFADGFATHTTSTPYYVGLAARAGAFAWTAHASLHEYGLARRRMQLGLVDPLVVNRFLLFGAGMAAVFGAFVLFWIGQIVTENPADATWVLAATCAAGLFAAVPTWLAFLPPRAYRRRFETKRAAPAQA